ncbi:MAG: helix-turn-helix transcriptional regulator [Hyphomicrobiaceae bacterium]
MSQAVSPARAVAIGRIRTALIEKKMTQAGLADASDCHEKTIQNLLAGRTVRDQTLFDVAVVLGLDFDDLKAMWHGQRPLEEPAEAGPGQPSGHADIAPVYMGAYTRAAVDHLIGSYLTIRPAFTRPAEVIAYRTDISWDPAWPSLLFEETSRPDGAYAHRGRLHVPASSPFIHLVSLTKGAMRMVMVSQLDQTGRMRGIITTVAKSGAVMFPVSAPIVYLRRDDLREACCGEIAPGHACHDAYDALLRETLESGYAHLVSR